MLLVVFLQFILWLGYIPSELRAEAVGVDETQRLPRSFATEAGPAKALPLGYHTTNPNRPPVPCMAAGTQLLRSAQLMLTQDRQPRLKGPRRMLQAK